MPTCARQSVIWRGWRDAHLQIQLGADDGNSFDVKTGFPAPRCGILAGRRLRQLDFLYDGYVWDAGGPATAGPVSARRTFHGRRRGIDDFIAKSSEAREDVFQEKDGKNDLRDERHTGRNLPMKAKGQEVAAKAKDRIDTDGEELGSLKQLADRDELMAGEPMPGSGPMPANRRAARPMRTRMGVCPRTGQSRLWIWRWLPGEEGMGMKLAAAWVDWRRQFGGGDLAITAMAIQGFWRYLQYDQNSICWQRSGGR